MCAHSPLCHRQLAHKIVSGGLSVRETEALVRKMASGDDDKPKRQKVQREKAKDADTKALESDLSAALGMFVSVDHSEGSETGAITVKYTSLDQLDDLCRILTNG